MKKHFFLLACVLLGTGWEHLCAFQTPLKTTGVIYPHILQTENYTLNTQNVKTLKLQGKFLWI